MEPDALREAIRRVAFAAATDEVRTALTGVKVEIRGSEAKFVASDGFRLAVYGAKLAEASEKDIDILCRRAF